MPFHQSAKRQIPVYVVSQNRKDAKKILGEISARRSLALFVSGSKLLRR